MNAKIMEGLVGAGTNIHLVNTPMKVYREAKHKGDTGAMERAMGYAGEFAKKAEEYKTKAEEGLKEEAREAKEEREAKEAREQRKTERERAVEYPKQEEEHSEEKRQEREVNPSVTVDISEEGYRHYRNSQEQFLQDKEADI